MAEEDTQHPSDKVSEQKKPPENESETVAREAVKSVDEIVKMKREEIADQKDPNRPLKFTSLKFGRLELVAEEGAKILIKGVPPEEPAKRAEPKDTWHAAEPADSTYTEHKPGEKGREAKPPSDLPQRKPKSEDLNEEDFKDFVRTGGLTKNDDPKAIEKALTDHWNKLKAQGGSATDLDLTKLDALNEVLNKSRKLRGIPEPDILEQLGVAKSVPGKDLPKDQPSAPAIAPGDRAQKAQQVPPLRELGFMATSEPE